MNSGDPFGDVESCIGGLASSSSALPVPKSFSYGLQRGIPTGIVLDSSESGSTDGSSGAFRVKYGTSPETAGSASPGEISDITEKFERGRTGSHGSEQSGSALTAVAPGSSESVPRPLSSTMPYSLTEEFLGEPNKLGPYYLPPTDPNFVAYASQYQQLRALAAFSAKQFRQQQMQRTAGVKRARDSDSEGSKRTRNTAAQLDNESAEASSGMAFVDLDASDDEGPEHWDENEPIPLDGSIFGASFLRVDGSGRQSRNRDRERARDGEDSDGFSSILFGADYEPPMPDYTADWVRDPSNDSTNYDEEPLPAQLPAITSISPRDVSAQAFPSLPLEATSALDAEPSATSKTFATKFPETQGERLIGNTGLRTDLRPPMFAEPSLAAVLPSAAFPDLSAGSGESVEFANREEEQDSVLDEPDGGDFVDNEPIEDFEEKKRKKKSGKRSHECNVCGKVFSTSGYLGRHKKVHADFKPHACPVPGCESTFNRHDNMLQHWRSHIRRVAQQQRCSEEDLPPDIPRPPKLRVQGKQAE